MEMDMDCISGEAEKREELIKFLQESTYRIEISNVLKRNERRLIVNISDLRDHADLDKKILRNPSGYMQSFNDAATELAGKIDPKFLESGDRLLVGFTGSFPSHTPRGLLSNLIGSMVLVRGIVSKCSIVSQKLVPTSNIGLPTMITKDDNDNLLVTEYGSCKSKDHQTLSLLEMADNSLLPRTVDIIVEDDLVDKCKPGDRVAVVGVYKVLNSMDAIFRRVLIANNVTQLNEEAQSPNCSEEELDRIRTIAAENHAFDLLGKSLAPSMYGYLSIKKAAILLMLGGEVKNLKNGTRLRGDINMLMFGNSVAKSQLLRAFMNISPLAISTTGQGSLTAAFTSDQETGERSLEAGAMVLADRGVVFIDEFDKMNDQDCVAIHEVMEQQTVTIAEAGVHASLNAQCSVVASIYGSYIGSENLNFPVSLLSCFDLLFSVDEMDPNRDVSEHVLRMHQHPSSESGESVVDNEILKKYIHYAKHTIQPKLTDEASGKIANTYAGLRIASSYTGGILPITVATLETIIRLSTAHAKLKLRKEVTEADVDTALDVLESTEYRELVRMAKIYRIYGHSSGENDRSRTSAANRDGATIDPMEIEGLPTQSATDIFSDRKEEILSLFCEFMSSMSIEDIKKNVNKNANPPYSTEEILVLLEELKEDNKVMVDDGTVYKIY